MSEIFVSLQVLLLVLSLPLLATSLRTSRSRRSRHSSYLAMALTLIVFAIVGALLSFGASHAELDFDPALNFAPPVLTLLINAWVTWRAVSSPQARAGRRPSNVS